MTLQDILQTEFWSFMICGILFAILYIIIFVAIVRWILRINVIVDLLKQIAKTNEGDTIIKHQSDLKNCTACEKKYPTKELIKIDSGQLLCFECYNTLKNKKREKI
jgi:hypothetical protein